MNTHDQSIITYAINNILTAMLKLQSHAPMSADTHLCQAVVLLNQLAELNSFSDHEMLEQLNYCQELVTGNQHTEHV